MRKIHKAELLDFFLTVMKREGETGSRQGGGALHDV
jgi:hypothetical protein